MTAIPILKSKPILSQLKHFYDIILRYEWAYRLFLRLKYRVHKPRKYPNAPWHNAVLKTVEERDNAIKQVQEIGLHVFHDLPKNWDSLAALDCILGKCRSSDKILDAGAEIYSVILPWLFLYGYTSLQGINIVFDKTVRRGPIEYRYGDVTRTAFGDCTFDAITCLSVLEHGVNLVSFFKEMSRVLKTGGLLIVSVDYYPKIIDSRGQVAYGVPIHIFSKEEMLEAFRIGESYGLYLTGDIDLDCTEKVVSWDKFELDYTFVVFTLEKRADPYVSSSRLRV